MTVLLVSLSEASFFYHKQGLMRRREQNLKNRLPSLNSHYNSQLVNTLKPAPGAQVSVPPSPFILSLPPSAVIESSPPPAFTLLLPSPASMVSAPEPVVILSFPAPLVTV